MIALSAADPRKSAIETLVVPVCEDRELVNAPLDALLALAREVEPLKGEEGESVVIHPPDGFRVSRAVFMGVGKADKLDLERWRKLAGRAVKYGLERRLESIAIAVPETGPAGRPAADIVRALAEGAALTNHVFDRYKAEKKVVPLRKVTLLTTAAAVRRHRTVVERAETVCAGTVMAREWVSTPSNDKVPAVFAQSVAAAARSVGLKVAVMDEKALVRNGFGAMLAVAAGSRNRPALVILEHRPKGARQTLALVGKGVTFDSGGINLKPSGSSIEDMKQDMAGAAAVAAAMVTIARLNPRRRVIGALPLVENMPSGSATRPGDIIRTYAGKTVEIGNTDAEGRLILADAMAWVIDKYKPEAVVDVATLTGACIVALGERIAGLFTGDDPLAEAVLAAAASTGERCWRLPLPEDYKEQLKSEFADLSNIGSGRWGGAITAALFLAAFTEKTRWAHLDIAGPAYVKKPTDYGPAGGTGFGVRLLVDLLDRL